MSLNKCYRALAEALAVAYNMMGANIDRVHIFALNVVLELGQISFFNVPL
jgi:hypothetical protein